MSKSRRKYSAEFKHEAVRLTQEPGRTVAEVAGNLGISPGVLQRWRSQMKSHGADVFPGHGRPRAADEEVLRLRKELARVQQERDILKKATAFFACQGSAKLVHPQFGQAGPPESVWKSRVRCLEIQV